MPVAYWKEGNKIMHNAPVQILLISPWMHNVRSSCQFWTSCSAKILLLSLQIKGSKTAGFPCVHQCWCAVHASVGYISKISTTSQKSSVLLLNKGNTHILTKFLFSRQRICTNLLLYNSHLLDYITFYYNGTTTDFTNVQLQCFCFSSCPRHTERATPNGDLWWVLYYDPSKFLEEVHSEWSFHLLSHLSLLRPLN